MTQAKLFSKLYTLALLFARLLLEPHTKLIEAVFSTNVLKSFMILKGTEVEPT